MANPTFNDWLDFMSDTITIEPWVADSVSMVPQYSGIVTSYPAYIELNNHLIRDANGREIMARGRVFVGATTIFSVKDRLTLPAGHVPLQPPILAANPVNDDTGTHHITLEIG